MKMPEDWKQTPEEKQQSILNQAFVKMVNDMKIKCGGIAMLYLDEVSGGMGTRPSKKCRKLPKHLVVKQPEGLCLYVCDKHLRSWKSVYGNHFDYYELKMLSPEQLAIIKKGKPEDYTRFL